jgi:aryl sulfotransferase
MIGDSFFDYENSYWAERARANLLMVHYNDLKADLAGEVARISRYLEIDTPAALLGEIAATASFETMKRQGDAIMGDLSQSFDGGSQRFLHKGVNGRWRDVLTAGDLARFDALVRRKFSPACAAWIEGGRLVAGDPRTAPD